MLWTLVCTQSLLPKLFDLWSIEDTIDAAVAHVALTRRPVFVMSSFFVQYLFAQASARLRATARVRY